MKQSPDDIAPNSQAKELLGKVGLCLLRLGEQGVQAVISQVKRSTEDRKLVALNLLEATVLSDPQNFAGHASGARETPFPSPDFRIQKTKH